MNTHWNNLKRVGLLLLLLSVQQASAYYDPGVQRWLNRDPLGDSGSLALLTTDVFPCADPDDGDGMTRAEFLDFWSNVNRNLFTAMDSNPVSGTDAFGLCDSVTGSSPFQSGETVKLVVELAEDAGEIPTAAERTAAQAAKKAVEQAAKIAKQAAERAIKEGKEAYRRNQEFRRWFHKYWKKHNKATSKEVSNPDADLGEAWQDWCGGGGRNVK